MSGKGRDTEDRGKESLKERGRKCHPQTTCSGETFFFFFQSWILHLDAPW